MHSRLRGLFYGKQKDKQKVESDDEEVLRQWSTREKRNEIEERGIELRAEMEESLNPSKNCLHRLYDLIRAITFLSSLLLLIGQLSTMLITSEQDVGPIRFILRIYVVILCGLICCNELECTKVILDSALLRIWVTRGLMYVFVGILGLAENDIDDCHNVVKHMNATISHINIDDDAAAGSKAVESHYVAVVAWVIVGCGILYSVMGLLCMQFVVGRLQKNYAKRRK